LRQSRPGLASCGTNARETTTTMTRKERCTHRRKAENAHHFFALPERLNIFLAPESPEQVESRKRTTCMHRQRADDAQHHFSRYQRKNHSRFKTSTHLNRP
ncbi:unnamed protein product, partial [Ectocarpus sp. 12 AP-2014]